MHLFIKIFKYFNVYSYVVPINKSVNYIFKQNKYLTWYNTLIHIASKSNRAKSDNQYFERHHIIPKSLGGDNSDLNLVLLTPKEHFIAHLLLVRMVSNKDTYRMINAVRRFKTKAKTSTEYELLRRTISKYSKGELNPSFGKIWIHNKLDKKILYILESEFNKLDHNVYIKGLPFQRGGLKKENNIWMNNTIIESLVKIESIEEYLKNNWKIGRLNPYNSEQMKNVSKHRHTKEKDIEHSKKLTGRIYVEHKSTGKRKRIHKHELILYEEKGYERKEYFVNSKSRKCMINEQIYDCISHASLNLNITKQTIRDRLNSPLQKWENWRSFN